MMTGARTLTILAAALLAGPAAEAGSLRLPDYFIEYAIDMTVANEVVSACPELGFDPMGFNRLSVAVEARLHDDGLLRPADEAFAAQVRESLAADERMQRGIDEIYRRLGVDPGDRTASAVEVQDRWCAAGRAEMQAASAVGKLLYDMR